MTFYGVYEPSTRTIYTEGFPGNAQTAGALLDAVLQIDRTLADAALHCGIHSHNLWLVRLFAPEPFCPSADAFRCVRRGEAATSHSDTLLLIVYRPLDGFVTCRNGPD